MRAHLALLTAAATLVLAACGGGATASPSASPSATAAPSSPALGAPEPTTPAGGAAADTLDGTSWIGTKADPAAPADVTQVRLTFKNGTLSGTGGCNQIGGSYQLVDGVLSAGNLTSTEMACADAALMRQDTWLSGLLAGATVKVDGSTLTLAKDGATLTLADKATAQPPAPVEGTLWVLDGIATGDTASSVPAGVTASVMISGGQAQIAFGCNSGGGPVTVSDTSLTFGLLASTLKLCEGPAGAVEAVMQGVLTGEVPYTVDGGTLTLTGANGTSLTFKAVS